MSALQPPFVFAVVGAGPNCLYLVERLYAHLRHRSPPRPAISVEVFDSQGHFGAGCHYRSQPATNHLNRLTDQISFAADETNAADVVELLPRRERPTLYEWCQQRYRDTGDERYNVRSDEWVERRLFGEASESMFDSYIAQLQRIGVAVTLTQAAVVDVEESGDGRYLVRSDAAGASRTIVAHFVALCTGHGETEVEADPTAWPLAQHAACVPGGSYVHHVYPIERLDHTLIPPGSTVACRGMGLAAIDVILAVTEGRGGRFVVAPAGDGLIYLPSGREPKRIVAFSESGVFLATRAHNQKMNNSALYHRAVVFTPEAIRRLRRLVGRPAEVPSVGVVAQLDFEQHVLPLIKLEMALLYYDALFGAAFSSRLRRRAELRAHLYTGRIGAWHDGADAADRWLSGDVERKTRAMADAINSELKGGDSGESDAALRDATLSFLRAVHGRDRHQALLTVGAWPVVVEAAAVLARAAAMNGTVVDPRRHLFDWNAIVDPLGDFSALGPDAPGMPRALAALRRDIRHASAGNIDNPLKRAVDGVWRDLRGTIREVVEFGGITARSHAQFIADYARVTNRIAVGTSLKIMHKVLALAEHGVVDLSMSRRPLVAPAPCGGFAVTTRDGSHPPQTATVLINARVHRFRLDRMRGPLYRNLLARGLVREWVNPGSYGDDFHSGGIDIEAGTHLAVRRDGTVNPGIAALGPPTEGPLYFHLAAMRPYCSDPVIVDADRVARMFFKKIASVPAPGGCATGEPAGL